MENFIKELDKHIEELKKKDCMEEEKKNVVKTSSDIPFDNMSLEGKTEEFAKRLGDMPKLDCMEKKEKPPELIKEQENRTWLEQRLKGINYNGGKLGHIRPQGIESIKNSIINGDLGPNDIKLLKDWNMLLEGVPANISKVTIVSLNKEQITTCLNAVKELRTFIEDKIKELSNEMIVS